MPLAKSRGMPEAPLSVLPAPESPTLEALRGTASEVSP
jgi:hypothetical protein